MIVYFASQGFLAEPELRIQQDSGQSEQRKELKPHLVVEISSEQLTGKKACSLSTNEICILSDVSSGR